MVGLTVGAKVLRLALLAVTSVAGTAIVVNAQDTTTSRPKSDSAPLSIVDREAQWPRTVRTGGTTLIVSQPQVDAWDGFALEARFAVKATGPSRTTYGVVSIDARTLTDKESRTVVVDQANVVNAHFPAAAKDEATRWAAAVAADLATPSRWVALDRLETALVASEVAITTPSQPIDTTPPRIMFVTVPTVLVSIDGEPQYRSVPDTRFERLINTRALVVRADGGLYLKIFDGWLRASSLGGPWRTVENPSADLAAALTKARQLGGVDELTGQTVGGQRGPSLEHVVPAIHIATTPTELIVTDGPGNWTPVHGLRLFYLLNATGRVLKSGQDFKVYALVAGRWFSASNIFGTWTYVSANALPSDFSKIPDSSPIENVKASIPGTKQAREAAIAAMIAQTQRVTPTSVHPTMPRFDGTATFKPIEGTSLEYAANTALPIVRAEGNVYSLENGIWFKAGSVNGPWTLATSVPAEVYTIPSTSPLYYVTFARVFATSGDAVYVGQFSGYQGSYIDPASHVVVYGTGQTSHGWVDHEWFGAPATYGFGGNLTFTPWTGWVVAFGLGWAWGDAVLADARGWGVYPWWSTGSGLVAWTPAGRDRPLGLSYNSRTAVASAGQRGALVDLRGGSAGVQAREVAVTPSGEIVPAKRGGFFALKPGDRVIHIRGSERSEAANGNVERVEEEYFAGRDGVVYRRSGRGWEAHTADGWQAARTTDAMLDQADAMRDVADWRLGMMRESSGRSRP